MGLLSYDAGAAAACRFMANGRTVGIAMIPNIRPISIEARMICARFTTRHPCQSRSGVEPA